MRLKDADRMANSADPNQTAGVVWSILFICPKHLGSQLYCKFTIFCENFNYTTGNICKFDCLQIQHSGLIFANTEFISLNFMHHYFYSL